MRINWLQRSLLLVLGLYVPQIDSWTLLNASLSVKALSGEWPFLTEEKMALSNLINATCRYLRYGTFLRAKRAMILRSWLPWCCLQIKSTYLLGHYFLSKLSTVHYVCFKRPMWKLLSANQWRCSFYISIPWSKMLRLSSSIQTGLVQSLYIGFNKIVDNLPQTVELLTKCLLCIHHYL